MPDDMISGAMAVTLGLSGIGDWKMIALARDEVGAVEVTCVLSRISPLSNPPLG